jgi:hypothetical protein
MRGCSSLAALPARAVFCGFFVIESPMQAAVNDQRRVIPRVEYFHSAVQEELFISVKFDNAIKALVRNG